MADRILYVDDEPNLLNSFKRMMRREPFECITFQSAAEALEKLDEIRPAVVISDQRMPEMPGTDFLMQVKDKSPDTVRIIITGFPDYQVAMSAINQGNVYRFLEKPWVEETLKGVIREAAAFHEILQRLHEPREETAVTADQFIDERFKGVQELAGAVSHSLCQPVQVLQGYADIIQMRIREGHELYLYIANLQKQIGRMKDILNQIQSIDKYRICTHAGGMRMIDLEKASTANEELIPPL